MFWRQLREKCLYSELAWPVLRHILSEYGNLFCKSSYSVQMRELKNSHQKKTPNTDTFHTVVRFCGS